MLYISYLCHIIYFNIIIYICYVYGIIHIFIYSICLFTQHRLWGLLNSAGERVRLSLLVLLFADPPYPAGVIVVIVVIVWTPPNN